MTQPAYQRWVKEIRALLEELGKQDFGYPVDKNEVLEPQRRVAGLPPDLEPLYEVCDGVSLPDVHVGYFLHPARRVVSAAKRGEPTRIEGKTRIPVHVFGSDGGGGRFALADDRAIYYLPSGGAVIRGAFLEDKQVKAIRKASSVAEFLRLLRADVEAFVNGVDGHRYLTG